MEKPIIAFGPAERPARKLLQREGAALTVSAAVLALLATVAAAWVGRDFLMPVAIAAVLAIMLSPVVRTLEKLRLPPAAAAAIVTIGLVVSVGAASWALTRDFAQFSEQLPRTVRTLEAKARDVQKAIQPLSQASDQLQRVGKRAVGATTAPTVVIQQSSPLTIAVNAVLQFLVQAAFAIVLTFFFLSQRRKLKSALIHMVSSYAARRRLLLMFADIKKRVSKYLLTISIVNVLLGVAIGASLAVMDFPNAPIWGAVAIILNFVPYAGSLAVEAGVLLVGLVHYGALLPAVAPFLVVYALVTMEGHFLTPLLVGRRVVLNPLAVFLAIGFGGWLWGVVGAVVAVPGLIVAVCALQHWWRAAPEQDVPEDVKAEWRVTMDAAGMPSEAKTRSPEPAES